MTVVLTELVLASRNARKLKEMQALLRQLGVTLHLVSEFSDIEPEESAGTFVENALIKARHAARVSGLPALADDSGLEVAVLHGAPGVHSARYAGFDASFASTARMATERPAKEGRAGAQSEKPSRAMDGWTRGKQDQANNEKLLDALRGYQAPDRAARFVSVLALLRHADDPVPLIAHGFWSGSILDAPRGANGFGYDPLFFVPAYACSSAELAADVKDRISHRARASAELLRQLQTS